MASERSSTKGQAWFCTTGLPSDIVVEVDEMTFHLHKFPLMSKSSKLHQLITEQEQNPTAIAQSSGEAREARDSQDIEDDDDDNEIEEVSCLITLPNFPGGSEIFEMAAKFCYGVKVDISSSNVAPLRCAGEFLEMTDEYCEDNLISKTESFLSVTVLRSLKESVRALKSCERVMALAEELEIPQRCIDAVVSRASSADPSLFGWPVSEGTIKGRDSAHQLLWNGIDAGNRRKGGGRSNNAETWLEDLSLLNLNFFKRLISAMREGDLNCEIVESCLIHYARKHIPGVSRSSRKPSTSSSAVSSETEQRELLETIITNLPPGKSSRSSTGARFLFGLLRTANILNASEECRSALERKVGSHLEQATLDDLLIPSYSYLNETLYDVDCVERVLGHFLESSGEIGGASGDVNERCPTMMLIGKLIDGYLSEIASDANLKADRFYNLAISLPEQSRLYDDGLYRAVDVYLKAHPWMTEADREKICGVMDCQKLTLEACTHAAQNERLPLRAVVQVLFFEQLQLRHAIAGTLMAAEVAPPEPRRLSASETEEEEEEDDNEEEEYQTARSALVPLAVTAQGSAGATWRAAVRENQVLRLDMDSMRTRVHQLERECSTMKKVIEKIDRDGGESPVVGGWRGSLNRKFGCKFKTQVCDSHAPANIVEARKGKHRGPSRT